MVWPKPRMFSPAFVEPCSKSSAASHSWGSRPAAGSGGLVAEHAPGAECATSRLLVLQQVSPVVKGLHQHAAKAGALAGPTIWPSRHRHSSTQSSP